MQPELRRLSAVFDWMVACVHPKDLSISQPLTTILTTVIKTKFEKETMNNSQFSYGSEVESQSTTLQEQNSLKHVPTRHAHNGDLHPHCDHRVLKLANPKPLGVFSFTLSTTLLSLINIQARSVRTPNVAFGLGNLYFAYLCLKVDILI